MNCAYFSCRRRAIIPDTHMNSSQRDWLLASPNTEIHYRLRTFQSATAHLPASWARSAMKIATVGTGWLPFFKFALAHILILCFTQSAMPRQSDEEESQLPSDSDYVTPQTERRKCWAERVPFSGEGSSSTPSPIKEINSRSWDGLSSRELSVRPM